MYGFDLESLILQKLPPARRAALGVLAQALFRIDTKAMSQGLEEGLIDAKFQPSVGLIVAGVKRILAQDGLAGLGVRVEVTPNSPYHYDIVLSGPVYPATGGRIHAWLKAHNPAGIFAQVYAGSPNSGGAIAAPSSIFAVRRTYGSPAQPFAGITWQVNANAATATHLDLEVSSTSPTSGFSLIQRFAWNQTGFDYQVVAGQQYWFRVRNYNQNTGTYSAYNTLGAVFSHSALSLTPPVLSGQRLSGNTIELTWTYGGDASAFDIYKQDSGGTFRYVIGAGGSARTYRTDYPEATTWRVVAREAGLVSDPSNPVTVAANPNAPVLTVQRQGSTNVLTWTFADSPTSWEVYRRSGPAAAGDAITTLPTAARTYTDSSSSATATALYSVRPLPGNVFSNEVSAQPQQPGDGGPVTGIVLGGVVHQNTNAVVDQGTYNLVYRTMPGSVYFQYTPRAVLKALTTTTDMKPDDLPEFSLAAKDLVMSIKGLLPGHATKLLKRGFTQVDPRAVYNANGGSTAPNRPDKDIRWDQRVNFTTPNNFDFMPQFQAGQELSPAQIEELKGWVNSEHVQGYFDGIPAKYHALDWEFTYNDNTWTQLADQFHALYQGTGRGLMSWMALTQIPLNRIDKYDFWNLFSYFHLTDYNVLNATASDGNATNLANWMAIYHQDYWGLLMAMDRGERFSRNHPGHKVLNAYMTGYEDGLGGSQVNFNAYKLHPSIAENASIWGVLTARVNSNLEGGVVMHNPGYYPGEPLNSEQLGVMGLKRLSFLNPVRSGAYTWVIPQVSYDNGASWREQCQITGASDYGFSMLGFKQVRGSATVKEPHIRCLVSDTHVVAFGQNPYPDAPAVQTVKIKIPGVIEDYVTMYRAEKTQGALTYQDRELTVAVAARTGAPSGSVGTTMSLAWPVTRQVVQRDNSGQGLVRVEGTISQAVDRIEVRATSTEGGTSTDWVTLVSGVSGPFNATVALAGGRYTLDVRAIVGTGTVASAQVQKVGVGEVFIIAGQSNAQGGVNAGDLVEGASDDRVTTIEYVNSGFGTTAPNPLFAKLNATTNPAPYGKTAWCWGTLGDALVARLGVPVLFMNAGLEGTPVRAWKQSSDGDLADNMYQSGSFLPAGAPYNNLKLALQAYLPRTGVRAVLWHQGESDKQRAAAGQITAADYRDDLTYVIGKSRTHAGKNVSWVVARASYYGETSSIVISGQNQVVSGVSNVFAGPETDTIQIPRPDGVHFKNETGNLGHRAHADAWNTALGSSFFTNSTPHKAV